MPRGKKRDANAIQVTVRPNTDGAKKSKTMATKGGYTSRKKYYAKVNGQLKSRTVNLKSSYYIKTPLTRNTIAGTAFSGNDVFANQPMGRDQMFGMYEKCYVKSAVQDAYVGLPYPTLDASGKLGAFIVNHWVDNNSASSASMQESNERCLSHDGNHIIKQWVKGDNDDGYAPTISENMVHSKISGGTKAILHRGFDDVNLAQTSGSGPTTNWYFHLEMYAEDTAGTANFENVPVEKITEYTCIFFDPKELAVS